MFYFFPSIKKEIKPFRSKKDKRPLKRKPTIPQKGNHVFQTAMFVQMYQKKAV